MARIRSLKAEFFTDENLERVSFGAMLTLLGLGPHADDGGTLRDHPKLLKGSVWPLRDDVGHADVAGWLDELAAAGEICRYTVDGVRYLHLVHWERDQKIKNPSETRLPACPRPSHGGPDPDRPVDAPVDSPVDGQDQGRTRAGPGQDQEEPSPGVVDIGVGEGVGGGVGEGKTYVEFADNGSRDAASPTARPVSVDRLVFEQWQQATGKTRAKLDAKRRRAIQRALKAYPLEDVLDAVRGWQHDPWTERPRHNDLTLLLRDADHVEKFRDLWRDGPPVTRDDVTADLDAWAAQDGSP